MTGLNRASCLTTADIPSNLIDQFDEIHRNIPCAGKIVRVIALANDPKVNDGPAWSIEVIRVIDGAKTFDLKVVADCRLRPLPGEKEVEKFDAEKELQCR